MMPEKCPYYSNFKCPYVGIVFCSSPCFDCYVGELLSSNVGIDIESGEIK